MHLRKFKVTILESLVKALKFILVAISICISVSAFAGESLDYPVSINFEEGGGWVEGSMWTARSSDDADQMIGCARSIGRYPDPFDDYGYCQAKNVDGVIVGCFFFNPDYFDVISSINAFSYINFGFDDVPVPFGGGFTSCTYLVVSAKSSYLPFTPVDKEKVK